MQDSSFSGIVFDLTDLKGNYAKEIETIEPLKKKCLNLGCGTDIKMGDKRHTWINIDKIYRLGVDIKYDLNKLPYPFKDNTFDYIYASHILEHLTPSIYSIIEELIRISKDKGIIKIIVPHYTSSGYFSEGHIQSFKYNSFFVRNDNTSIERISTYSKIIKEQTKIVFDKKLFFNYLVEPIMNRIPKIYENTFLKYLFPASEYRFTLRVNKGRD